MRDGEVVVRRIGNVSVTFDHRVIDGKRAADFGLAVIAPATDARRRSRRCGSIIDSIFGAVERPSSRATTRLPLTSASDGTSATRKRSREVGALVDVDLLHAQRAALLARDVREQALHPPRRAGAAGREEDEQGRSRHVVLRSR